MSSTSKIASSTKQQIQEITAKLEDNTFAMLEIIVRGENMNGATLKVRYIDDDAEDGLTVYFSNASNFYEPVEGKLKFGALVIGGIQYGSLEDMQMIVGKIADLLATRH